MQAPLVASQAATGGVQEAPLASTIPGIYTSQAATAGVQEAPLASTIPGISASEAASGGQAYTHNI